jgi:hypothetical protein
MNRNVLENKFLIKILVVANVLTNKQAIHVETERTSVQLTVHANVRTLNQPTVAQEFKNGTKIYANVNVQRISLRQHVLMDSNGMTTNVNVDVQLQLQLAQLLKNTQM